ncbi:MAG: type 4a pilus biogenesis protein PilO [Candidatus Krumholzibacteria bacterium]|nr:type 4a pilus biogenesis protein PilO [Candidatus Krumholzibacteria bacterium]
MNLKDPKVQKIMLGVMSIVILSYVYFGTSFFPINYPVRRAKIKSLEKEYDKLSAELEKARKMVGNLARLEAEYERLHDQWLSAQELLPEEKEMPDLLRQVTTSGLKSGVEFALFEPGAPVPRDFYTEHPVKIEVRGGYHQLGIFMSRLANMTRIVNVSKLELTAPEKKKGGGKEGGHSREIKNISTVQAEFTLSAYTLLGGVDNENVEPETASVE